MENINQLAKVAQIIEKELGLYYPESRFSDLERGLVRCSRMLYNDDNPQRVIEDITADSNIRQEVTESLTISLTINETYFFREKPAISFFIKRILPILSTKKGPVTIWSAGCSSGEEPYTIAILIKEHLPDLAESIKIIATDISHKAIKKAHEGLYSDWSFRETPLELRERYFTKKKSGWKISQDIVKMVSFGYLNLARDKYPDVPGGLDAIFCRNVLMYFSPNVIHRVSSMLYSSLCENGFLLTSQVELNDDYFSVFEKIPFEGGFFYSKVAPGGIPLPKHSKADRFSNVIKSEDQKKEKSLKAKNEAIKSTVSKKREKSEVKKESAVKSVGTEPEELYSFGEYERCIELCTERLKSNKMNPKYLYLLAKCHANTGEYTKAAESIDKIIESGTYSEDIYYLYATVLMEQNDISGAIGALKRGIYINPGHLFSHLLLGNISKREGNRESAERHYNNVLNILQRMNENDTVPDSGGLTRARLFDMVDSLIRELK